MFERAQEMEGVIHLEIGEPGRPPPPHVRDALTRAVAAGVSAYTQTAGIPSLREALAVKVAERNRIEADPGNVVVTPGAIAGLHATLIALCDPGDEILIPDPGWPNFRMIAAVQGIKVRTYPAPAHVGLRLDLIEPLLGSRTKAIVVNSPSNPTGAVIAPEELVGLVELACQNDVWVISDEVYDELVLESEAHSTAAVGGSENVVSVFSFSKTYAMTGWRLGYVVAPTGVAEAITRIQQATTTCASAPIQHAGLAAIEGPADHLEEMRNEFRRRRDRALAVLLDAGISVHPPRGAFYLWVDIARSGLTGVEFAERLLEERGVAVAPGDSFGASGEDFVRVSLGDQDVEEGVSRIAELFHHLGAHRAG
jgi:aspartate/methionine/tyrosine aminotransferase